MKIQSYPTRKAYSLIELLIVIGIIVIVLAFSLNALSQSQSTQLFSNNFAKLFSLISNARSQAITGKGQLDFTDFDHDTRTNLSSPPDYVTPANYGIHFQTDSAPQVVLFADINPPESGAMGARLRYDEGTTYDLGQDVVLDSLYLPEGTILDVQDGTGAKTSGSIFYSPNYADINFENLDVSTSPFITIKLSNPKLMGCRIITMHKLAGIPEVGPCT